MVDGGNRIGVLKGGLSAEREISLMTGAAVEKALKEMNMEFRSIDWKQGPLMRQWFAGLDVVFIALHGGDGEDGTVQKLFDSWGIAYTGSGADASAKAMDKFLSKEYFAKAGLKVSDGLKITRDLPLARIETWVSKNGLPVVVKPNEEGSSIGVSIVEELSQLPRALETALDFSGDAVVEKFIAGRSMEVSILEDRALPIVEVKPKRKFYDYQAKYFDDATEFVLEPELPVALVQKLQDAALRAHKCLGCRDYSRVDLILTELGDAYVLEVNTLPGMTNQSILPRAAARSGISFKELVLQLIHLAKAKV